MLRALTHGFNQDAWGSDVNFVKSENKFQKFSFSPINFVDLGKNISQSKKINYISKVEGLPQ